ncbi:Pre-mRNA-splicing factor SPF27 [Frankliniella fusca]|uniref:Pre-mRNA-splicing factor SPF27 n=1 Tax=Frankliniella fusca TaxID=407009 RepID=A0AAE1GTD0_9NEOP|nr:Pre-mRNA-splicing factor SPF27 [Frankliniella fusca]
MAGEVIVDALPYIDQGYDEAGVREAALAMVEEETRRYRPTKNYLEHLPPLNTSLFETEMMKSEWERMQQRQPMDVLSMKRYELPPPPGGKMTEIAAWTECVENSQAQLEHQATRKDIQEINWERKNAQMKGGEKLRELEATWVGLVSKNYDIEQACVTVEEEIMRVEKVKENALKRRRMEEERISAKRRKLEQREQERQEMLEKQREEQMRQEQLEQEAQETSTFSVEAREENFTDEQQEQTSVIEQQNGDCTEIESQNQNQVSPNSHDQSDSNQSDGSGGAEDSGKKEDSDSI